MSTATSGTVAGVTSKGSSTAGVHATVRARIEQAVATARSGSSSVLVLTGEPGIGKTSLLREAAASPGVTLLAARGCSAEASTQLCALGDLLRPVRHCWGQLEPRWRELLEAVLNAEPSGLGELPAALHTATLLALAAAAEHRPLLLVVDDAHWLDDASAAALRFVCRRLDAEAIAVLVARRSGEPSFTDGAGFNELELGELGPGELADVLAAHDVRVAPFVAASIAEATGGNPLGAIECARALSDAQRRGSAPLPEPLPIGRAVDREFARQVRQLPRSTALALVLLAADHGSPLAETWAAMPPLGLDAGCLEPAERMGLVSLSGDRATWRHPLVRLAAYHAAAEPDRRRVHAVLATVVENPFRRAWHLGAAALGADEAVARELAGTARQAMELQLPGVALRLFRRAAELSASREARCQHLADAAAAAAQAGLLASSEGLAARAAALAGSPEQHAQLLRLRCRSLWSLARTSVHGPLVREAAAVAAAAPGVAADLLADAALAALSGGDVRLACGDADEAGHLAAGDLDPQRRARVDAVRGLVLTCSGKVPAGYALIRANERAFEGDHSHVAVFLCLGRMIAEDYEDARWRLETFVEWARTVGAIESLGYPLGHLADLDLRTGHWARSYARAGEAVQAADLAGQRSIRSFGLAWMARFEALTGLDDACREHVEEVLEATRDCDQALRMYVLVARGEHALGRGEPAAAVETYRELLELVTPRGHADQAIVPWLPGLVEALVAVGKREEAATLLEEHGSLLTGDDRRWPRATYRRLRGMLADDPEERERLFVEALALHAELPMPFERARTELALGTARRRAGERRAARQPLSEAHRTFSRLGAAPWARRAERELAATGERVRARPTSAYGLLSPQELSVATLVAEGKTNIEVAAALFLSPKTVEAHLSRAFRKLAVTNRSQLGLVMRELAGEHGPSAPARRPDQGRD